MEFPAEITPPFSVAMRDVARRAGVHSSTVSRALRNDPRITPAVRAAIQRLAREMRYRPNPLVSALILSRRSPQGSGYRAALGYISKFPCERAASLTRDYAPMAAGAVAAAARHGYRLDPFDLNDTSLTPKRLAAILHARGVRGLVLAPLHTAHDTLGVDWSAFSVVAVGLSQAEAAFNRVSHDHFADALLALKRCRDHGYRRVGFTVLRRVNEKVEKRWLAAYLLDQVECRPADRVPPLLAEDYGSGTFAAWFRRHRPEVVLCANFALVTQLLKDLGADVPGAVGVASLGSSVRTRTLAGIHQDIGRLGAAAVDMLVGMLHRNEQGIPEDPQMILLAGRWTDGRSLPRRPARVVQ